MRTWNMSIFLIQCNFIPCILDGEEDFEWSSVLGFKSEGERGECPPRLFKIIAHSLKQKGPKIKNFNTSDINFFCSNAING